MSAPPNTTNVVSQQAAGTGSYVVQTGDCISSIAAQFGLFWQTIWDHPDNASLKTLRGSPNVLLPGDRLTIPAKRVKQAAKSTDQRHRFVRKGVPVKFRLRLIRFDYGPTGTDEPREVPRANQHYILTVDGALLEGDTDADGILEQNIPPTARQGKLIVGPDKMELNINLGGLDPSDTVSGIQHRLNNLGYPCGADGVMTDETRQAIRLFQQDQGLPETGELDGQTKSKLESVHSS